MRLDGNYYYWPPGWVQNVPGMFTGSGMPMRFADLDGTMIDVYQASTQMTDESGQIYPFTIDTLLDRALGATGYYGAFNANMHTDDAVHPGSDAIVASAKARGVPVVSAQQMLTWLDGRNGSTFEAIQYSGGVLSFRVTVGAGATGLRGMVPAVFNGQTLQSMTRDGAPRRVHARGDQGRRLRVLRRGRRQLHGDVRARHHGAGDLERERGRRGRRDGDGDVDHQRAVGLARRLRHDGGARAEQPPDAAAVTAHSVRLTGLTPGATYHYRVRSADGAGNATTSPAAASPPATFAVPLAPVAKFPAATVIETGARCAPATPRR